MTLEERMKWLADKGCYPSIYKRGNFYRAHVNIAGNFWEDATTPGKAMEAAVRLWRKVGCPLDGEASTRAVRGEGKA